MHSSNDAKLTRTHRLQHTCASLFSFPPTQRKGPVSYTHLDVYKRQARTGVPNGLPAVSIYGVGSVYTSSDHSAKSPR